MHPLCRHEGETLLKVKPSLRTEYGNGANAGAVLAAFAMVEDVPQEVMILLHGAIISVQVRWLFLSLPPSLVSPAWRRWLY